MKQTDSVTDRNLTRQRRGCCGVLIQIAITHTHVFIFDPAFDPIRYLLIEDENR